MLVNGRAVSEMSERGEDPSSHFFALINLICDWLRAIRRSKIRLKFLQVSQFCWSCDEQLKDRLLYKLLSGQFQGQKRFKFNYLISLRIDLFMLKFIVKW
jgi:prepilin signal peptidase PulO-like enzyme (type II secretory pathway)